jgi:hypothetical protein
MRKQKIKTEVNETTIEAIMMLLRTGGIYTSKAMVACILSYWEMLEDKSIEMFTVGEIAGVVRKFRTQYPEPVIHPPTTK